jgi:hypothetical protein
MLVSGRPGSFAFGTLRLQRTLCLDFKIVLNMLMTCSNSTSDHADNASFASGIEHVHNFTVILPHRMQGMTFPPTGTKAMSVVPELS